MTNTQTKLPITGQYGVIIYKHNKKLLRLAKLNQNQGGLTNFGTSRFSKSAAC